MNFMERMEAGRVEAVQRRNRGLHTGKSAKGWNVKRPADNSPIARGKVAWQLSKMGALELYERAVFPERYWSGYGIAPTIDDVMRANEQAARDSLLATF